MGCDRVPLVVPGIILNPKFVVGLHGPVAYKLVENPSVDDSRILQSMRARDNTNADAQV